MTLAFLGMGTLNSSQREGLPGPVVEAIQRVQESTKSFTRATLCLAINYGSRAEMVDAVRSIARDAAAGRVDPESIDEAAISSRLYTKGLPDPDLLIRTAGERRISNFLLWQISYAELHVTETCWPDFGAAELHAAIRDYAGRERRFGGLEVSDPG